MKHYESITILTGAGVSAESGIRTFRDANGLWENHRVEEVASPEGFARNPSLVHRFYNQRRRHLLNGIQPNPAHRALARLEREFTGSVVIVTQNIDNLHELAGSHQVMHMHGELLKLRCQHCQSIETWLEDSSTDSICPSCSQAGTLRPHVVWFGEIPLQMEAILRRLCSSDLFVAIGTSGSVYPAAGFFDIASQAGAHTLELNLEPSLCGSQFDEQQYGPASRLVPHFVAQLL